jgi:hypothetical protein
VHPDVEQSATCPPQCGSVADAGEQRHPLPPQNVDQPGPGVVVPKIEDGSIESI